jgi:hypothetical protein
MKKLSILLLALAIAAFAVPAMAGDVAMDGEYTWGGESWTMDSGDYGTFYDELDLNIEVSMGDVLFHWDVEIVDDPNWDRSADEGGLGEDVNSPDKEKLVDTMWVKWMVNDALSVKVGDMGLGWGNDIVMDAAMDGTGSVNVVYTLDVAELGFWLSRDTEGGEDDITTMGVTAEGTIGPADLGVVVLQTTDDINNDSNYGLVGAYGNFVAGPVAVSLELGSVSADDNVDGDGGQVILAEFALDDLVGFGLNIGVVSTNEDYEGTNYSDDFDRAKIYDAEETDQMMVYVGAEYGVNDQLSVGANLIAMNDIDGNDGPTEIDVYAGYSFADNVSVEVGYGTLAANDGDGVVGYDFNEDMDIMWYEFVFDF